MGQISMKKIMMDELLFILQQNIILKKLSNILFCMVQLSMKKINPIYNNLTMKATMNIK